MMQFIQTNTPPGSEQMGWRLSGTEAEQVRSQKGPGKGLPHTSREETKSPSKVGVREITLPEPQCPVYPWGLLCWVLE